MTQKEQELLAYLQTYLTPERFARLEDVLAYRTRHFAVVLEDVFIDRNEGAIMRTCDCFGIQDVYMIESKYNKKIAHSIAKGAEKWLTQHRYDEGKSATTDCIRDLKDKGYQIVATTPHTNDYSLHDFDISKPSAFVFGAEKTGISKDMQQHADAFLRIPMYGFTESFNVSVAAAVMLQDLTKRLHQSEIQWKLEEEDESQLRLEWTIKSIKYVKSLIKKFETDYTEN